MKLSHVQNSDRYRPRLGSLEERVGNFLATLISKKLPISDFSTLMVLSVSICVIHAVADINVATLDRTIMPIHMQSEIDYQKSRIHPAFLLLSFTSSH